MGQQYAQTINACAHRVFALARAFVLDLGVILEQGGLARSFLATIREELRYARADIACASQTFVHPRVSATRMLSIIPRTLGTRRFVPEKQVALALYSAAMTPVDQCIAWTANVFAPQAFAPSVAHAKKFRATGTLAERVSSSIVVVPEGLHNALEIVVHAYRIIAQ